MIVTGKSKGSSPKQEEEPTEFSFHVRERPVPKGRPRLSRKGRVYTPAETVRAEKAYEESVGGDHPVFEGNVRIELMFKEDCTFVTIIPADEKWSTKLRGDIDNYIKLALDGIQRAGIIANDRQVVQVDAIKV